MKRTIALLAGISVLGVCRLAGAVATAAPTVTFEAQNGATVPAGTSMVPVSISISDPAGLRSASLSGANRSAMATYSSDIKSATMQLYWFTRNSKAGDYTFKCTVYNANGGRTDKTVTYHLVK